MARKKNTEKVIDLTAEFAGNNVQSAQDVLESLLGGGEAVIVEDHTHIEVEMAVQLQEEPPSDPVAEIIQEPLVQEVPEPEEVIPVQSEPDPIAEIVGDATPPVEPPAEPVVIAEPESLVSKTDALLAELFDGQVPEVITTIQQVKPDDKPKGGGKSGKKKDPAEKAEKKEKKPVVARIPVDAPIPVVEFRGLTIGVYGNILEELEEADKNGYKFAEVKLERFNATAHETFRASQGRMVLVGTQGGGTYLVAAHNTDGTMEAVIEVTNRGRGCLRCRQIAQVLHLAYQEKTDVATLSFEDYNQLKAQIALKPATPVTPPVVVAEPVAVEENKPEAVEA